MRAYWLKFTDGCEACCEGQNELDAVRIAEKVVGKKVDGATSYDAGPNVKPLPFPAAPVIWQFDHPVLGKTPDFCYSPKTCQGHTGCPQKRGCCE